MMSSGPDNADYNTVKLCSENATELACGAVCTALQTYTKTIAKRPLLNSELNGLFYPMLTHPASHSRSVLNFGGPIAISWTNPSNVPKVSNAGLVWEDSLNTRHRLGTEIAGSSTTVTLEATSYIGQSAPAAGSESEIFIWLHGRDIYERYFNLKWDFQ